MIRISSYTTCFEYAPVDAAILMHGYTGAVDLVPIETATTLKDHKRCRGALSYKSWLTIRERGYVTAVPRQLEIKRMLEMLRVLKGKLSPRLNVTIDSISEPAASLRALLRIFIDLMTPSTTGTLSLNLNHPRSADMVSALDVAPHWPATALLAEAGLSRLSDIPVNRFLSLEIFTLLHSSSDADVASAGLSALLERGARVLWIIVLTPDCSGASAAHAVAQATLLKQKFPSAVDFLLVCDTSNEHLPGEIAVEGRYYAVIPQSDLPLYRRVRNFLRDPSLVINATPFFRGDIDIHVADQTVLAGSGETAQAIASLSHEECNFDFRKLEDLISTAAAPEVTREDAACPFALVCGCGGAKKDDAGATPCAALKQRLRGILPAFFYS